MSIDQERPCGICGSDRLEHALHSGGPGESWYGWLLDSHGCVVVRGVVHEDGSEGEVSRHRYEMAKRISEMETILADAQTGKPE